MDYAEQERQRAVKTEAVGYDYEDSRLLQTASTTVDENRVQQYLKGIITGGELDCLILNGCLPYQWYDQLNTKEFEISG